MEIQRFNSINDGFSLRTVEKDGEPWFIAADVCRVLEIGPEQVRHLDSDEYALFSTQGIEAKNPQMNVVSEAGLYSLVLGSRKLVRTLELSRQGLRYILDVTPDLHRIQPLEGVAWIAKKAKKCG